MNINQNYKNCTIFQNCSILIINIGKNKIDELNQKFEDLNGIIRYKIEDDDKNKISQYVLEIINIIGSILDDTRPTKNNLFLDTHFRHNPFFQAIDSALYFLKYLDKEIDKEKRLTDPRLYTDFKLKIEGEISTLSNDENETIFKSLTYEWLYKEKYINDPMPIYGKHPKRNGYYTDEELDEFYDKKHRKIFDFVFSNCSDLNDEDFFHKKADKTYLSLITKYKKLG